ncbi:MAG: sigma-70 family RNA polymerase sigma factor [Anaerolineae bacterium]|nr:sigma-70 family RNA polymerase sigma factor [Anaerolineae bacterium]NIN94756.1 sigma-70 family RNA polymerase sigma factor [Anaerolineae bacterium]NIQ77838.1 sigma-70 family RNA polymerase sigma factor [Anaerolineae bacterium]
MLSGEVHSLAELYERYSGAVFDYLLRVSGDRPLADDLTSETFFRAMVALDGFRGEASVKTWLLRIARNLYLRRAERDRRTTSLEHLQEHGVSFAGKQLDPETYLLRQERSHAIQRALLSLRESDRSILLLSARESMSCREIGEVLDISVTAVKVRLYRARRRLTSALDTEKVFAESSTAGQHRAEEDRNVEL